MFSNLYTKNHVKGTRYDGYVQYQCQIKVMFIISQNKRLKKNRTIYPDFTDNSQMNNIHNIDNFWNNSITFMSAFHTKWEKK